MIYEACQEGQLSYEYRDGATSYGAFTFSLAKALRSAEREGVHLTFRQLARRTAVQLKALRYQQTPNLDGPGRILKKRVPWVEPKGRHKRT